MCLVDFKNYPPEVEECFSRAAFAVLEDSSQVSSHMFNLLVLKCSLLHFLLVLYLIIVRLLESQFTLVVLLCIYLLFTLCGCCEADSFWD